jgi:hypothetical protein
MREYFRGGGSEEARQHDRQRNRHDEETISRSVRTRRVQCASECGRDGPTNELIRTL